MKASIKLSIPDDVSVTITITGSIKDFKTMNGQLYKNDLRSHWPLSEFAYRVKDAIEKAEREWMGETDTD